MKRILITFFSLALVLIPAPTLADGEITICYEGETLKVPEEDLIEYSGYALGSCEEPATDENSVTICHYPEEEGLNPTSLVIDESAWPEHEEHGDTLGECDDSADNENDSPAETENSPPVFSEFNPPLEAYVCEQYYYQVEAEDSETNEIHYILEGYDQMVIDEFTGVIDWTPSGDNLDESPLEVLVGIYDGENYVETSYLLEVLPGNCEDENSIENKTFAENNPPVIEGPDRASTTVGETLEIEVAISDPDGDSLEISTDLPEGASYDATSSIFSWTPAEATTTVASFSASDGTATTTLAVSLEAVDVPGESQNGNSGNNGGSESDENENRAPVIDAPWYVSAALGENFSFPVVVSDPDNDSLSVATELPEGAAYSVNDGTFVWTPSSTGRSVAIFEASDGEATSSFGVVLEVLGEDYSPSVCGDINLDGVEDGRDIESYQNYIFMGENPVAGVNYDLNGDGAPDAVDLNILIDYIYFGGDIPFCANHENRPPTISAPTYKSASLGETLEIEVAISDPDGDSLEISTDLPEGASYDATSSIFSWTPASAGRAAAIFYASDGGATTSLGIALEIFGENYRATSCGDVNEDGIIDQNDIDAYAALIFDGAEKNLDVNYDFNGDELADSLDLNLLIDYIYFRGEGLSCDASEPPEDENPPQDNNSSGGGGNIGFVGGNNGGGSSGGSGGGPSNLPPEFVNFAPPLKVASYEFYSYDAEAVDPEDSPLVFSLLEAPENMAIIPETGIIYWYPQGFDEGNIYSVKVQVSDGVNSAVESYQVEVTPGIPPAEPETAKINEPAAENNPVFAEPIAPEEEIIPEEIPPTSEPSGTINAVKETSDGNTGLLAAIGAWFGDNLFIPILAAVVALILYLIYLAFIRRKDEKTETVSSPEPTKTGVVS